MSSCVLLNNYEINLVTDFQLNCLLVCSQLIEFMAVSQVFKNHIFL